MNISFREKIKMDSKNENANEHINADEIGQVTAKCDTSSENHCTEIIPSCRNSDDRNSITNFYANGIDSEIDLKAIENDCLESSDY